MTRHVGLHTRICNYGCVSFRKMRSFLTRAPACGYAIKCGPNARRKGEEGGPRVSPHEGESGVAEEAISSRREEHCTHHSSSSPGGAHEAWRLDCVYRVNAQNSAANERYVCSPLRRDVSPRARVHLACGYRPETHREYFWSSSRYVQFHFPPGGRFCRPQMTFVESEAPRWRDQTIRGL